MLLKEIVTLLFVQVITCLVADVQLQVLQLDFTVHYAHGVEQALFDVVHLEQFELFLHNEWHVRTNEVQRHDVVGHVVDGKGGFIGQFVVQVNILLNHLTQILGGRLELTVSRVRFRLWC